MVFTKLLDSHLEIEANALRNNFIKQIVSPLKLVKLNFFYRKHPRKGVPSHLKHQKLNFEAQHILITNLLSNCVEHDKRCITVIIYMTNKHHYIISSQIQTSAINM